MASVRYNRYNYVTVFILLVENYPKSEVVLQCE